MPVKRLKNIRCFHDLKTAILALCTPLRQSVGYDIVLSLSDSISVSVSFCLSDELQSIRWSPIVLFVFRSLGPSVGPFFSPSVGPFRISRASFL